MRWWAQVARRPRPRRDAARRGRGARSSETAAVGVRGAGGDWALGVRGGVWRSSHKRLFRDLQWPVRFSYSRSTHCCGRTHASRRRHPPHRPTSPPSSHTRHTRVTRGRGAFSGTALGGTAYRGFRVAGSRLWPGLAFGLAPRCLALHALPTHAPQDAGMLLPLRAPLPGASS